MSTEERATEREKEAVEREVDNSPMSFVCRLEILYHVNDILAREATGNLRFLACASPPPPLHSDAALSVFPFLLLLLLRERVQYAYP